jgi:hypothetical protein
LRDSPEKTGGITNTDLPEHKSLVKRQKPVDMSRMPPRFKDQEVLYQSRVERHWQKTSKMLEKMGFVKKHKFDRLLLEELGLVGMLGEEGDSELENE